MNQAGIVIRPDESYRLPDGVIALGSQIAMAFMACHSVVRAYAIADEANGGSADIDWGDIDDANDEASVALGPVAMQDVIDNAREVNDFGACHWPRECQVASEAEGWGLVNIGESDMRLERDDDPASGAAPLEDDSAAWRLVYLIDTPLHWAARSLLQVHAPDEHARITEYIEGLLTGAVIE